MSQPIPHAADIAPWLSRHQPYRMLAQSVRSLTDPFQASFDGIACPSILLERLLIHTLEIARDPFSVLDDVGHAVVGIVPSTQNR
jgi:hypothetical protein